MSFNKHQNTQGSQSQESYSQDIVKSPQLPKKQIPTFSKVVTNSMFPKKSQAILIDTVEGVEIKTYLKAIAAKTAPTNIVAPSKISQNRFCCYLNDTNLVDQLTKEGNNDIVINGQTAKIRTYVQKSKRVIFSNVHPCIPHDVITDELKLEGITPKSSMSFIRLGIDDIGFTQILSFRRQLFVSPEDVNKLPKEITVNHEDTIHHVYISTDRITCFVCNLEGYTARCCPTAKNIDANRQVPSPAESHVQPDESSENTQLYDRSDACDDSIQTQDKDVNESALDNTQQSKEPENQTLEFNGTPLFKKPTLAENSAKSKRATPPSNTSTSDVQEVDEVPKNAKKKSKLSAKKMKISKWPQITLIH